MNPVCAFTVLLCAVFWTASDAYRAAGSEFLSRLDELSSLVRFSGNEDIRGVHHRAGSRALRMKDPGDVAWVLPMTKTYTLMEKRINLVPTVEKRLKELNDRLAKISGQDDTSPEGKKLAEIKQKVNKMEEVVDDLETTSEKLKRITERVSTALGGSNPPVTRCENGIANSGILTSNLNMTQNIKFKEAFHAKPHVMAGVNLAGTWDPAKDPTVPIGAIDFFIRKSNITDKGFTLTFLSSTQGKKSSLMFVNWMACGS